MKQDKYAHYIGGNGRDNFTLCGLFTEGDEDHDTEEFVMDVNCPICCKKIYDAMKKHLVK